jgi:hypothetical protein
VPLCLSGHGRGQYVGRLLALLHSSLVCVIAAPAAEVAIPFCREDVAKFALKPAALVRGANRPVESAVCRVSVRTLA